jgi:hypothetical protein
MISGFYCSCNKKILIGVEMKMEIKLSLLKSQLIDDFRFSAIQVHTILQF